MADFPNAPVLGGAPQQPSSNIDWNSLLGVLGVTNQMGRSGMDISGFRRSSNVEDNRSDTGPMALLRAMGLATLYQGQGNYRALQQLFKYPFGGGDAPQASSDPMAIAAGYNNIGRF
jgi:hypothetical protein